jgi:L-asparaginase/Glu-tRNA(Gln) amidotransferase subunit D
MTDPAITSSDSRGTILGSVGDGPPADIDDVRDLKQASSDHVTIVVTSQINAPLTALFWLTMGS